MTLRPLLPLGLLVLVGLVATGVCVLGFWRATRTRTNLVAWSARLVMVWALVVVGAQPSTATSVPIGVAGSNVDVLLVVDRTGSMAALDWDGDKPRLDGVRHDVQALVAALPGVRWSVIAWDSQVVRTLPFTTDSKAVTSWAVSLRQEITYYSGGSQIDRPLDKITQVLANEAQRRPQALQYLVVMSDGESTTGGPMVAYRGLRDHVAGGLVLGYGTNQGGQMRSYDGSADPDPNAAWITDAEGNPAVSRIDEQVLTRVASDLDVRYVHRTGKDTSALLAWAKGVDKVTKTEPGRTVEVFMAQTWPAAALLALAVVTEVALAVPRRTKPGRGRWRWWKAKTGPAGGS
ncbi:MAG: VWA domain-containing protein [Micrococcales bacterium]|nr:VWA domain-containing protein [Micrococcales bacterium]MCL2667846.1 VWA domain-containing protein [Micrococcales bacterium]